MLRLSRMTDYGAVVLSRLAEEGQGAVLAAPVLARELGIPEPTVGKLLKALAGAGLVASHRGTHGGYALSRAPEAITVGEIIAALEGPVALVLCLDGAAGTCGVEAQCPIRGRWDSVNQSLQGVLESVSLADMVTEKAPLPVAARRATVLAAAE